jgi:hypothetical protein
MWIQLSKIFTRGLGPFAGFLHAFRKSVATRVEALEEDEKEEGGGDAPAEEAWECWRVWERAAQECGACVRERGGRGPECGERQHEQQVEVLEHEQRGGEARMRYGDVEGRGRSVFAKSRTDLHKCQVSSEICQICKNAKQYAKLLEWCFCDF